MRNPRSTVSMFMMFGGTIGSTVSTVALYFVRNHQIVANDFNFVITNKSTIYPNENFNFECSLFQGDKPLSSISNDARYNFSLYDEWNNNYGTDIIDLSITNYNAEKVSFVLSGKYSNTSKTFGQKKIAILIDFQQGITETELVRYVIFNTDRYGDKYEDDDVKVWNQGTTKIVFNFLMYPCNHQGWNEDVYSANNGGTYKLSELAMYKSVYIESDYLSYGYAIFDRIGQRIYNEYSSWPFMRKLLEGINIVTIYRKGGLASMDGFKNGNALKNIQNYFMPINGYFIPKIEHMVQLTRRDNSRQFLMAHSKMAPNSITNGICMSSTWESCLNGLFFHEFWYHATLQLDHGPENLDDKKVQYGFAIDHAKDFCIRFTEDYFITNPDEAWDNRIHYPVWYELEKLLKDSELRISYSNVVGKYILAGTTNTPRTQMPFRFVLWFWMGYAANNWDKIVPFINKQWPSWPLSSEDTKIAMTYFDEWQEFMNERMHEFYEWNLTNYEEEKKLGWY